VILKNEQTDGGFKEFDIGFSFEQGISIMSHCKDANLVCHFLSQNKKISFLSPCKVPWLDFKSSQLVLEIKPKEDGEIFVEYFDVKEGSPNKIPLHNGHIAQKPSQSFSIGVWIPRVFRFFDKEAEILTPDNKHLFVKENTANFKWHKNMLYCNVPIATTYKIRFRGFVGELITTWSDWASFSARK